MKASQSASHGRGKAAEEAIHAAGVTGWAACHDRVTPFVSDEQTPLRRLRPIPPPTWRTRREEEEMVRGPAVLSCDKFQAQKNASSVVALARCCVGRTQTIEEQANEQFVFGRVG